MRTGSSAAPIQAVLFDLDGTLYHQAPLRWRMLRELALTPLTRGPLGARRLARILGRFRKERELMREVPGRTTPLAQLQYQVPAQDLGVSAGDVEREVVEWMYERPLRHLRPHRRAGVGRFMEQAQQAGLGLGCFSDYPVDLKLEALGLSGSFDVQMDATQPDIDCFKPEPKGFLVCAERLGVDPQRVLYVGDRPEVDGEGARRAGMPVIILSDAPLDDGFQYATSMKEVWRVVRESN